MLTAATFLRRSLASGKNINYYEVLNLTPQAKQDDVKKAYRQLVKKYHPDVTEQGSNEKFRAITEAYNVLKDYTSRAKYDLTSASYEDIQKSLSKKRDIDGLDVTQRKFEKHTYGYRRLQELAQQRKEFNIDRFGKYQGGLPAKDSENTRAGALGAPGLRADTSTLRHVMSNRGEEFYGHEAYSVDEIEAENYKKDRVGQYSQFTRKRPYLAAEVDYDFSKFRYTKKLIFMFGSLGALYGISFFINQSQKVRNLQLIDQMLKKPNKEMRNAGMRAVGWS